MDLSDGLADAIRQVSAASDVGMVLDAAAVPIHTGVREWHERAGTDALETALSGGDDYELMFTVRPSRARRLRGIRGQLGDLPITRIGVVTRDRTLVVASAASSRPLPAGFEHFR
jgi:thiamine-monophosphate kinase